MNLSMLEIAALCCVSINAFLVIVFLFIFVTNFIDKFVRRWQDRKISLPRDDWRRLIYDYLFYARYPEMCGSNEKKIKISGVLPDWFVQELTSKGYKVQIDSNTDTFIFWGDYNFYANNPEKMLAV